MDSIVTLEVLQLGAYKLATRSNVPKTASDPNSESLAYRSNASRTIGLDHMKQTSSLENTNDLARVDIKSRLLGTMGSTWTELKIVADLKLKL